MHLGPCHCMPCLFLSISETLQLPTLHYIIQLIASYYESMVVEKKQVPVARQWGQRLVHDEVVISVCGSILVF